MPLQINGITPTTIQVVKDNTTTAITHLKCNNKTIWCKAYTLTLELNDNVGASVRRVSSLCGAACDTLQSGATIYWGDELIVSVPMRAYNYTNITASGYWANSAALATPDSYQHIYETDIGGYAYQFSLVHICGNVLVKTSRSYRWRTVWQNDNPDTVYPAKHDWTTYNWPDGVYVPTIFTRISGRTNHYGTVSNFTEKELPAEIINPQNSKYFYVEYVDNSQFKVSTNADLGTRAVILTKIESYY